MNIFFAFALDKSICMTFFGDIGMHHYIASTISSILKLLTRFGIIWRAEIKSHMRAQIIMLSPFIGAVY